MSNSPVSMTLINSNELSNPDYIYMCHGNACFVESDYIFQFELESRIS